MLLRVVCGQTVMYQTLTVWFPELSASDCGHACWLVVLPKRFMGHKCWRESPRETQGYERLWPGFFPAIKWELAPRSFSFHTVSHISSVSQRSVILLMVSWNWMIHFFLRNKLYSPKGRPHNSKLCCQSNIEHIPFLLFQEFLSW